MTEKDFKFKVFAPTKKDKDTLEKSVELNSDGTLTVEGVASTTNVDLQDEVVSISAIESMRKQATNLNLHGDHHYNLFDGVIGSITEAKTTDNGALYIKATILSKYAKDIKDMLDIGINLGFSIGGIPEFKGREVSDIKLLEISLTAMPANWDTFGTVEVSKGLFESTCISGACYNIQKEAMKNMANNDEVNDSLTFDDVKNLFNELMAEKEQTLSEDIISKITPELEKIAQEVYDKNTPQDDNTDDGDAGDANTEPTVDISKALTEINENITETVNTNIKNIFESEEFTEALAGKMFKNLDMNRNPQSTTTNSIPQITDNNTETKKTWTSEEAADMFLKNLEKKDPVLALFNK